MMRPIRRRSRRDPMRRLISKERRSGEAEGRGERRRERMIGKKRRPSPEISSSLRKERGRKG